jgi:1-acyl-sn-glycerol-3-phosphate acyltransferase
MRTLRAVVKIFFICVGTLAIYILWLPGKFADRLRARWGRAWRLFIFRNWARWMAFVMRMKITVQGRPPGAPFFLVTNHLSYVDILVLAAEAECVFISRHDVASWPILGHLTTGMRTIYIDRGLRKEILRVHRALEGALARGEGLVLFAEGTSSPGAEVLPLKPALLELAVARKQPISYASLSYRTPAHETPAHLAVCWWGDMTFGAHFLNLLKLERFEATLVFGEETLLERDRKVLAEKLHALISKQFTPVVKMEELCRTAKV